jgi:hypothetical protein
MKVTRRHDFAIGTAPRVGYKINLLGAARRAGPCEQGR